MSVYTGNIKLDTDGHTDVIDITDRVKSSLDDSGFRDGILCVWNPGSTGSLTTVEYEPGCVQDLEEMFEEIAPSDAYYHHHERWQDGNGHSHMRASLLGPSISIPFHDGSLDHGTWQQIVFIDFDNKSRNRNLTVQIVGEK